MAFAGFKKQMNKTTQLLSEKMGKSESSKLDEDFLDMERQVDATAKCMEALNNRIMDYLQPNPVTRAKLVSLATYAKARGTASEMQYPQVERQVGEMMCKGSEEIGSGSSYASAVNDLGEGFMRLADVKDSLDCDIKQNFIDPMEQAIRTEYRENIQGHRKKMYSRRLDYDYKISQQDRGKVTEDELYTAEDKFNESMQNTDIGMKKFLQDEEEHIHQLMVLVGFMKDYHTNSLAILEEAHRNLQSAAHDSSAKPKLELRPIARISSIPAKPNNNVSIPMPSDTGGLLAPTSDPPTPPTKPILSRPVPSAKVMFDFEAENASELDLKENDIVILVKQIDENWYEGELNGRRGYFPTNYVEVINPL